MTPFDALMTRHQAAWRDEHVDIADAGYQNGRAYGHILPRHAWEQGLWPGVRPALGSYLASHPEIQPHTGIHNLKSSWVLCANLYFPFGQSAAWRELLAGFLRDRVDPTIETVDEDGLELEFAEEGDLSPARLLGETGGSRGSGQTSPDLAIKANGGRVLVLVENKFTEHSFYRCSALRPEGSIDRPANPDRDRCLAAAGIVDDPTGRCHQASWGRKYWDVLAPVARRDALAALICCPAARGGYQLLRQQALAEGIARAGKYDAVVSCAAVDERNTRLLASLASTGLDDLRDWGSLFEGQARFTVCTHQQWVAWVRTGIGQDTVLNAWSDYIARRYQL